MEGGEWGSRDRDTHEPIPRDAAPRFRTYETRDVENTRLSPSSSDVWAGALQRLQTQVSLNTSMLEAHSRQVGDIEQAVGRLQQEMGQVIAVINEMRGELQARSAMVEQARHDPEDLQVLASQVAAVTSKANELDGLRMQVELMKNRIKRFEDLGSPVARPGTSMSSMERGHDGMHPSHAMQHPAQHPSHHPSQPQHLPPMRTASTFAMPTDRSQGVQPPHVLPSQGPRPYQPHPEARMLLSEQHSVQPSQAPTYRPSEPLPPPSAISSWRPAESHGLPPPQAVPYRPQVMEAESQSSGWAAVNANVTHPMKRPFEERRQSPYGPASAPGSPKRPRLAPIMPRAIHPEDGGNTLPTAIPASADVQPYPRSRAASDGSQAHSHLLPTPASANTNAYRFITSTAEAEAQAGWRPEAQHFEPTQQDPAHPVAKARGRGRGSRGGRGRSSRTKAQHQQQDLKDLAAAESESAEWTGGQVVSPEGYYRAVHAAGGAPPHRTDGNASGPSDAADAHDFPATPVSGHPHDPFGTQADLLSNSSKKSRSKPTRNADGVLIRKDGRPDMRSVSSAKNLRAVHAKREAEKAEADGHTPSSSRSVAPAHSNSMSEEDQKARSGSPESDAADGGENDDEDPRGHPELVGRASPRSMEQDQDAAHERRERERQIALKSEPYEHDNEQRVYGSREHDSAGHSQADDTSVGGSTHVTAHAAEQPRGAQPEVEVPAAQETMGQDARKGEESQSRAVEQPAATS